MPLFQRYQPFAVRARQLLAEGRFGPISHIYVRINRPAPARYPAWDSAWMLDPAEAGGGCLRNLGSHGLDMFLYLTGEDAQVTGAQISTRAHGQRVEDYASVLLRSATGILGTVEVGNGFPRVGTDGEWKIAGRDAILTLKDGVLKLATAQGDETTPGPDSDARYLGAIRDALESLAAGRGAPDQRARLPARGAAHRPGLRARRGRIFPARESGTRPACIIVVCGEGGHEDPEDSTRRAPCGRARPACSVAAARMPQGPTYTDAELKAICERRGGWWRGELIAGFCEFQSASLAP